MQQVSFSGSPTAARWRPGATPVVMSGWTPRRAAPPMAVAPRTMIAAPRRQMAQATNPGLADTGLSLVTSGATVLTGFGLALMGGKHTTWRWIGGFAGALGAMRLLHDVSKV